MQELIDRKKPSVPIKCFLENTQSIVQWKTGVNPFSVLLQNACSRKQSLGDQVQMNCEPRNENRNHQLENNVDRNN